MNPVKLILNPPKVDEAHAAALAGMRVGYVNGAIGGPDRVTSLAALFPGVEFISVGPAWPERPPTGLVALIVGVGADSIDASLDRLAAKSGGTPLIIVLSDADISATRRLMRGGAADILHAPVSEAALALSLERLLGSQAPAARAPAGQVIAVLKAGGGTGATALATQLAIILAARAGGAGGETSVCLADLDLQSGLAAFYLDLGEAMTMADILGSSGPLEESPLASALARHRSGVRLLAAPRDLTPLETLSSRDIDSLLTALRRDFAITLLDMPGAWTAWTNRALQLCDRIVLVTSLSLPHIHLVKRQLQVIATQHLDTIPLTLVCNRLRGDQQALVSLKAAQKALGRDFDVVIPEDHRMMNDAIAQGYELSTVRRGSKLERAIAGLATVITSSADAPSAAAPAIPFWRRWS